MQRSLARVAELADAQDLGSCVERREGSSPSSRIAVIVKRNEYKPGYAGFFLFSKQGFPLAQMTSWPPLVSSRSGLTL